MWGIFLGNIRILCIVDVEGVHWSKRNRERVKDREKNKVSIININMLKDICDVNNSNTSKQKLRDFT